MGALTLFVKILSNKNSLQPPTAEEIEAAQKQEVERVSREAEERIQQIERMTPEEVLEAGTTEEQREHISDIVKDTTNSTMAKLGRFKKGSKDE